MFNKCYVINLKRCTDKRQHMENEFRKLADKGINLNHVFFDAVDGKDSNNLSKYTYNIPNWYDPKSGKTMTCGEVGCSLSHYLVWKDITNSVDSGTLPLDCKVIILEDDVVFPQDAFKKLEAYHSKLTQSYDMLYLHRKPLNPNAETFVTPNIKTAAYSYWTCAYILTYTGAKKLVDSNFLQNILPSDEFLSIMIGAEVNGFEKLYENTPKLKCYAVQPNLLTLTSSAFLTSETLHSDPIKIENNKFMILTTKVPDARFDRYCQIYGFPYKYLTSDTEFTAFKQELESWDKARVESTFILAIATTTHNIIPLGNPQEIIEKHNNIASHHQVVISTRFSDILSFCGYGHMVLNMLSKLPGSKENIAHIMKTYSTDTKNLIFHPLVDNEIEHDTRAMRTVNTKTGSKPCIIFARDKMNILLNQIENYTGDGWNEYYGANPPRKAVSSSTVYLSIRIKANYKVRNPSINYPSELITKRVNRVSSTCRSGETSYKDENELHHADIKEFLKTSCEYYFFADHNCVINNPNILTELLSFDKDVIAPLINTPGEAWSNFWGDLDERGYYKRSFDYLDILNNRKKGCWNVPYITGVYLIKRSVLETSPNIFLDNLEIDRDMRFCYNLRNNNISMYLSNLSSYGYFEEVSFDPSTIDPELNLYDLFTKKDEWERKYLHPTYYKYKDNILNLPYSTIVPDIYNFPLFSQQFCTDMIKRMELYDNWSKGQGEHNDSRLGKNYHENVPTQDIQMFEIGFDKHWKEIVMTYVAPVARLLYSFYKTKGVHLGFVVRYHFEGGQRELKPHHDASTYSINIALNKMDVDFTGGGTRFLRQNHSVTHQEVGTALIHPGRLTAYHEGLPITSGTRYILVSFID